ncbi:unnamed protein product, partial [Tetraodon nigroviridis]
KRLFETKRKDQLNALKNLVELNDVNQQYKIIDIMLKGLFKVLEDSRQILVAANMRPDDPFPMDDKIKEGLAPFPPLSAPRRPFSPVARSTLPASSLILSSSSSFASSDISFSLVLPLSALSIPAAYSHVVENTAFFGDVVLRFPRIVHHYYDRNSDWGGLLRWGLHFCNQKRGVHRRGPPARPHADVTGAGNHREKSRLHQPVPHRARRRASHRRGVQEDPEGGREEAEEGGEEERNQERPSHLPLPLGTLAPPPLEQVGRAGREEMGAHLQGSVGDPECRP